jgi:hypothetical protein
MITKAIQKDLVLELAEARARCLLELAEVCLSYDAPPFPILLVLICKRPRRRILRTSGVRSSEKFAAHKQLQATAKIVHLALRWCPASSILRTL